MNPEVAGSSHQGGKVGSSSEGVNDSLRKAKTLYCSCYVICLAHFILIEPCKLLSCSRSNSSSENWCCKIWSSEIPICFCGRRFIQGFTIIVIINFNFFLDREASRRCQKWYHEPFWQGIIPIQNWSFKLFLVFLIIEGASSTRRW